MADLRIKGAIVPIDLRVLANLMDLPNDTQVVGAYIDHAVYPDKILLKVLSPAFPETPYGEKLPEARPLYIQEQIDVGNGIRVEKVYFDRWTVRLF
jgi:hypothetical protein